MPSPFPGMDPYVEARWRTFHTLMINAIMSGLNQRLPSDLEAQIEEQVRVEDVAGDEVRGYHPDVAVVDLGRAKPAGDVPPANSAALMDDEAEVTVRFVRSPLVVRSVVVTDRGGRTVTAIELLSPWNKLGGRLNRDYRRKLRGYESADINWVELDLLRSSRDRLAIRWTALPAARRSTYAVVTFRAFLAKMTIRPMSIRHRLPSIGIPLREAEPESPLDLQAAFERTYADARFNSLDYTRPPDPPLREADAAWAAELLQQQRPSS